MLLNPVSTIFLPSCLVIPIKNAYALKKLFYQPYPLSPIASRLLHTLQNLEIFKNLSSRLTLVQQKRFGNHSW